MPMFKVRTHNQIALEGLERLPRNRFEVGTELADPEGILLRSHVLAPEDATPRLRAVARAGAGVNNIPVDAFTEQGIVVFNTPGANANSVKEIVVAGLLLACRDLAGALAFTRALPAELDEHALHARVEGEKKRFAGRELAGKTLGVVGLGAIGARVADIALQLGMSVLGYDPAISVDAAWRLPREVQRMENLASLLARSDFVTLHVPALPDTRGLINREALAQLRPGSVLLNFARGPIVEPEAVAEALKAGRLARYVADFPETALLGLPGALLLPHLGASTEEAETHCAVMAAEQLKDFLEHGNIRNSVNFPPVVLEQAAGTRLAVINENRPNRLGPALSVLAEHNLNVIDMLNKSRDAVAYNLIDVEGAVTETVLAALRQVEGVLKVYHFGEDVG
jgi:D-3-phosphoglycerate dehydrogenase